MEVFINCSLQSSYRRISRGIQKLVEHKEFRPLFSIVLVVTIVLIAVFPNATAVFGQMQGSPSDSIKTDIIATEDVIMTTKQTSQFPVIGRLSQRFSYYHPGIDIEQPFNNPIHPFLSGVIFETGFHTGGYGNYILIDHQNGYFSLYAHLNAILVKKSDSVGQDTIIGTVGLTGRTTGSHLHFEVYENGRAINPLTILSEAALATASADIRIAQSEPAVLPTRTLVVPIVQQPVTNNEQPATGGPATPTEQKSQKQTPGIWLPDTLKETTSKPTSGQLPKLVQL